MVYRVEIGGWVSRRLSRMPNVSKLPATGLDIFLARDVLTPADCAAMIKMIDADRHPSGILSDHPDPGFRTSETCNVDPRHPRVIAIEQKIHAVMGIQPEHGETIQGQRYAPGQQFKTHHDFFFTSQSYWPKEERAGGQRTWTAMVFLNQPEEGGHTLFPEAGVRVAPRAGNLLTWNNLDKDGAPNPFSAHAGTPVVKGLKYVITKWYRERPWAQAPEELQPVGHSK
jgi:prolyl 4-hydroxylase